eukprot:CAMPEP_0118672770 /NCGR_PEP_ID=MMETSP0785-20121206/22724_1 /TAXON_ID=91992 /ORGANISM="Bolidomonas pacifica, Strain CCMP 1866" /LENGTH=157 /DNA_ID=CAMNT_0006567767 /DNA_START=99 /DNA_END=572 /DNA_ORIENTATION=+
MRVKVLSSASKTSAANIENQLSKWMGSVASGSVWANLNNTCPSAPPGTELTSTLNSGGGACFIMEKGNVVPISFSSFSPHKTIMGSSSLACISQASSMSPPPNLQTVLLTETSVSCNGSLTKSKPPSNKPPQAPPVSSSTRHGIVRPSELAFRQRPA